MERFCLVDDCPGKVQARSLCSHHYYMNRVHGSPLPELRCADCGMDMSGANMGRQRCEECALRRIEEKRRARDTPAVVGTRSCYRCGADTPPTNRRKRLCVKCSREGTDPCSEDGCVRPVRARGLCSAHYKRVMRAEGAWKTEEWSERRRSNAQRRRAWKRGSTVGPSFTSAEVFERDRWRCGLCGDPVDSALPHPDPRSASLDHIVPLSQGGAHASENCQLAHLACNVRKGNRAAGEQLLLIG